MHKETLAPGTEKTFGLIAKSGIVADGNFYLAGGTALALELGHRRSEDLDFFTKDETLQERIVERLRKLGSVSVVREESRTVEAVLDSVRISFMSYPYPLIRPLLVFENIKFADERDIAAMKISAVESRGAKKDFFDLYVLMRAYSLEEMLGFFETKFAGVNYNRLHILKSLSYFEDAERDPDPVMLQRISWSDVKDALSREAHRLAQ